MVLSFTRRHFTPPDTAMRWARSLLTLRHMGLLTHVNRFLNHFGYAIERKGLGYLDPVQTVEAARRHGLSVCEYLERFDVGGVGCRRDMIVSLLEPYLPKTLNTVLEIGAGTGMYLDRIVELFTPESYDVYETHPGWVKYLEGRYLHHSTHLRCHPCDGKTLHQTESASIDAVMAHGVFVYLPLIVTFGYLEEAVRVLAPGGTLVFDCFVAERFDVNVVKQWQKDPHKWTFPVVIPQLLIQEFLDRYRLTLVGTFDVNYHASFSTYFVCRMSPLGLKSPADS